MIRKRLYLRVVMYLYCFQHEHRAINMDTTRETVLASFAAEDNCQSILASGFVAAIITITTHKKSAVKTCRMGDDMRHCRSFGARITGTGTVYVVHLRPQSTTECNEV